MSGLAQGILLNKIPIWKHVPQSMSSIQVIIALFWNFSLHIHSAVYIQSSLSQCEGKLTFITGSPQSILLSHVFVLSRNI